jgi:nicotinate-nucleotide--dimethylbenzimidazole phosphoribosyltransferase
MPPIVEPPYLVPEAIGAFAEDARRAVYDVIALRRDVRHFDTARAVDEATLRRLLGAAHMAPSVGLSQPWGFVVVRDEEQRGKVRASFLACREAEAARYPEARREQYLAHRLEGILESSLNLCVAVDLRPQGEAILGTTVQPEAVRASACCAVQNLWLAARAEGVGVGWVSIVEPAVLRAELRLPAGVEPIAYLCLGYPVAFRERPMLVETGWRAARPLDEVVHPAGTWKDRTAPAEAPAAPLGDPVTAGIRAPAEAARVASHAHQATLTKPVGSLGRLEELAAWWAATRGAFPARAPVPALAVFCADHGVVAEGVSAHPSSVTAAMIANVMSGGAAVSVLAARCGVRLVVVDVGVSGDLTALPRAPVVPLERRVVRRGTGNLRREPAMTRDELGRAIDAGAATARGLVDAGATLLGVGEIGIGNTTAATAVLSALTGEDPARLTGAGAGLDGAGVSRKASVIAAALVLHAPDACDPRDVLAKVGGLEIAAMAGFLLEAARSGTGVVLDGMIAGVAAVCAARIDPSVRPWLVAAHRSAEPAATRALAELGLAPLVDLGLRLGEGAGAVLGMDLVATAVAAQLGMATYATAGIVGRAGTPVETGS